MTTARKNIMLTPGPTPLPPEVLAALSRPILHHRTEAFGDTFQFVLDAMRRVYKTKNRVFMASASGTGAMEAAVVNLLSPSDNILVYSTGAFGDRFAAIMKAYGLAPVVLSEEWGHAAKPEKLADALKQNPKTKAVFLQQTDTSTGVLNGIKAMAAAVRANSEAVVVVDAVSSLAAEEFRMDEWGVDVALTASQKGLMNAPGLAFAAVSERAWALAQSAKLPKFYFDWKTCDKSLKARETPYTPAVAMVAAQAEALKLIESIGLENMWKRTAELADYTRAWARKNGLALFARDPAHILTGVRLPEGVNGSAMLAEILREDGISIADGQLALKGKIIRIAHMGHIGKDDLDAGFAALEKRLARAATAE
ncbi:MAG TPA: alanine--glyoxylate aminotransferase family protein [Elusimicrobiota bacterium]|nr:alanine--glyoxylate aminotransferase family protein [Elusimicrobiota bacterium]